MLYWPECRSTRQKRKLERGIIVTAPNQNAESGAWRWGSVAWRRSRGFLVSCPVNWAILPSLLTHLWESHASWSHSVFRSIYLHKWLAGPCVRLPDSVILDIQTGSADSLAEGSDVTHLLPKTECWMERSCVPQVPWKTPQFFSSGEVKHFNIQLPLQIRIMSFDP